MQTIRPASEFKPELDLLPRHPQGAGPNPALLELLALENNTADPGPPSVDRFLVHRVPTPDGDEWFIDWNLSWNIRIGAWLSKLGAPSGPPRRNTRIACPSDWLDRYVLESTPEQRARTARMLAAWDALFVQDPDPGSPPIDSPIAWRQRLRGDWRVLRSRGFPDRNTTLERLILRLRGRSIPFLARWHIPLPNLLAIAVLFSQTQLGSPIVWEAFAAAYADHQLRNLWLIESTGDVRACLDTCISLITFLIRHQHSLSILLREYGHDIDRASVSALANDRLCDQDVLDALVAFSILAEVRNRDLLVGSRYAPSPNAHVGSLDLRSLGVLTEANPAVRPEPYSPPSTPPGRLSATYTLDQFLYRSLGLSWDEIYGTQEHRKCWALNFDLHLDEAKAVPKQFQELVERQCSSTEKNGASVYALDRNLVRDIPEVFADCITRTVAWAHSDPPDDHAFTALFDYEHFRIPASPYATSLGEVAIAVRLNDRIAAQALMFRGNDENKLPHWRAILDESLRPAEDRSVGTQRLSARELLQELYDKSRAVFQLDTDALEPGHTYVPFPLVRRLLDVVARLKRSDCFTIELSFAGNSSGHAAEHIKVPIDVDSDTSLVTDHSREYIHFPRDIGPDTKLGNVICKYVHSLVLNAAMTGSYGTCDMRYPHPITHEDRKLLAAWKERLDDVYNNGAYWIFSDRYVRDYGNWRHAFESSAAEQDGSRYSRERTRDLLSVMSSSSGSAHPALGAGSTVNLTPDLDIVLLGIDVGATLVKIQFYRREGSPDMFVPCTETRKIGTPCFAFPNSQADSQTLSRDERLSRLRERTKEFAQALVKEIVRVVHYDQDFLDVFARNRRRVGNVPLLAAVGIAWPGPVRNNRIIGTSGIVKCLPPLNRDPEKNTIDDLLALDIAGELSEALKNAHLFHRHNGAGGSAKWPSDDPTAPVVVLLNDGLAEGIGHIASLQDSGVDRSLLVLKVGSGLGCAAFSQGRPLPGLWEAGKIALDLGAVTKRKWVSGNASDSLSKRFVSQYALAQQQRLRTRSFENTEARAPDDTSYNLDLLNVSGLDSQEICQFFEGSYPDSILGMVQEFGLRDLAEAYDVDVEILRRFQTMTSDAEPEWQNKIARILGRSGDEAVAEFKKRIESNGYMRLSDTLGVTAKALQDLKEALDIPRRSLKRVAEKMDATGEAAQALLAFEREIAHPTVEALGRRLGDLIALFYDRYAFEYVIVTGGVLSGGIKDRVTANAMIRLSKYDIELESCTCRGAEAPNQGDLHSLTKVASHIYLVEDSTAKARDGKPANDKPAIDKGAYGAAMAALNAFLSERQRLGRRRIAALARALDKEEKLVLSSDGSGRGTVSAGDREPIELAQYAMTAGDAGDYIEQNAAELQLYLVSRTADRVTYVYWPYA